MPGVLSFLVFLGGFLLIFTRPAKAQEAIHPDSVTQLSEVTVEGYISGQSLLQTPTSVGIVSPSAMRQRATESLLPALNAVPGVRMEERSPGSYRLSIRGSLLRSPWGVRNVKVYLDEFPLTDAGGNTYLNLVDPRGAGRLEVLKGPHGSLFGANSGGVLLINTATAGSLSPRQSDTGIQGGSESADPNSINAGISGGSYGMFHENLRFRRHWDKSHLDINQAFHRSDGYREHSGMRRHYLQAAHHWNYRPTSQLKVLAFYADMDYATPGGLNREQYEHDPRQARPAAGQNPGAVEQQAGIRNKTLFGGISHQFQLSPALRHMIAVFGSHTDFENPFITNYEVRDEDNYGLRTYLELDSRRRSFSSGGFFSWKWYLGLEWQRSQHDIANFDNLGNATRGDLQASDAVRTRQHFYFTRFSADIAGRLRAEAAVSMNYNRYVFDDLTGEKLVSGGQGTAGETAGEPGSGDAAEGSGERKFSPQWMPRLSISYLLTPEFSWRASVSRGYSPPTTAEIRPSNMVVNTALNPETGWNYETGFRFMPAEKRTHADASVFYYRMEEAIVRRLEEGGDEFFVNAGGTDQVGVEASAGAWILDKRRYGFFRGLQLGGSYTYSHFHFRKYRQGAEDYSGKQLTGVPRHVAAGLLSLYLPRGLELFAQHNYTSQIPLDDGNSVYAEGYHLLQLKLTWQGQLGDHPLELFAGADNLLNEKYSLGNDINAFGGRFYNAAPLRNFFGGIRMAF